MNGKWFAWYDDQNGKRIKTYKLRTDATKSLNAIKNIKLRYEYAERIKAEICSLHQTTAPITPIGLIPKLNDIVGAFRLILEHNNHIWRRKTNLTYKPKVELFLKFCKDNSYYENGKAYPDVLGLLALCTYFQTHPTTLLLCDMEALGLGTGEVVGIADLLKPQDAIPPALVTDELLLEVRSLVEKLLQTKRTELDYLTEALHG